MSASVNHELTLLPVDPEIAPHDWQALLDELENIGLIARPPNQDTGDYHIGKGFFHCIGFLGCSPTVSGGESSKDQPGFHYVRLIAPEKNVRFFGSETVRYFRCPHCKRRQEDFEPVIEAWKDNPATLTWSCPSCRKNSSVYDLDWRKRAGFGRCAISIIGIRDGLAVPGDIFMGKLEGLTHLKWSYIYRSTKQE